MKFKKYIASQKKHTFIIDEDLPQVGAVLYILKNNKIVSDYLQKSIQQCKMQAFKEYDVSLDDWQELSDLKEYPWLRDN